MKFREKLPGWLFRVFNQAEGKGTVAAFFLGTAQGCISGQKQVIRAAMSGIHFSYANTDGGMDGSLLHHKRHLFDCQTNFLDHDGGTLLVERGQENAELITADTADKVAAAQGPRLWLPPLF